MKKHTRYWATTLAFSGILMLGACGESGNTETDTVENEIEAAETETEAPALEEVNEEDATTIQTDADDRQTIGTENEVEYVADDETEANFEDEEAEEDTVQQ